MGSDDGSWSGYIPPHELRGLLNTIVDRGDASSVPGHPGPAAATAGSPGLAGAAMAPPPTAPALPEADPNSLALVIARMAGELFGGASVIPTPMSNLGTAPGLLAAPASPGISPQLVPMTPSAGAATDPVTPQIGANVSPSGWTMPSSDVAGVPNTAGELSTSSVAPLGGSSSAWSVPSELDRAASIPSIPTSSDVWTMPALDVPGLSDGVRGSAGNVPGLSDGGRSSPSNVPGLSDGGRSSPGHPADATAWRPSTTGVPGVQPAVGLVGEYVPAVPTGLVPGDHVGSVPLAEFASGSPPSIGGAGSALSPPGGASVPAHAVPTHADQLPQLTQTTQTAQSGARAPAHYSSSTQPSANPERDVAAPPSVKGEPRDTRALGAPAVPSGTGTSGLAPTVGDPGIAPPGATTQSWGEQRLPLFGDDQLSSIAGMPEPLRISIVDPAIVDLASVEPGGSLDPSPYWMPAQPAPTTATTPTTPAIIGGDHVQPGTAFDPYRVRKDFPILEERVQGGKRLVWLDNAATTQKPRAVIDRLSYYYEHENSNVHRAAHTLAARATDAFESARETTRKFLNATSSSEIVFVRGATEGINLIAKTWGVRNVQAGDEIVLTHLEHHANIVPWQQLCAETGARLRVAPVDDRGDVILEEYERLLCSRTKLVTFTQVSNALGTITPAREMIEIAHRHGATVLLDGAQAVSHMHVDVQQLDCDFYVFSGHKVFAPTGIGAVYGKRAILEDMPPWQGGGNMIADVTFEKTTYQPPPGRFEAGTGNIADAAGMGAALDYVMRLGMNTIDRYEHELMVYATERLQTVPGLRMVGTSAHKAGVLSFVLAGQRTEDVGAVLDKDGIAVRSGHHCAQPILRRLGLESSVRASLAFYNVREDIDELVAALIRLQSR